MQENKFNIVIFLIITTLLLLLLASLIITLIYLYKKKQLAYDQNLEKVRLDHEKKLMATQLEIQESTFQHISREIHDNINLSLTLAKLHLNTLDWSAKEKMSSQINTTIELLTQSIADLSDISKSLNSDIISSQGLITAIETEIARIRETGLFAIGLEVSGNPVFMKLQKELIIFRIIQEAFNNIIRHAKASSASIILFYDTNGLYITIRDDGIGFVMADYAAINRSGKAGLKNMDNRAKAIEGRMKVKSGINRGTTLSFYIPLDKYGK